MGHMPEEIVKKAGDYLLSILKDEPTIKYDRFYDGEDLCRQRLCKGMKMSASDADYYGIEGAMDIAISWLEQSAFVTTAELPDKLADGEQNYSICLTAKGRESIDKGTKHKFHGVDL